MAAVAPRNFSRPKLLTICVAYALLLAAFWLLGRHFALGERLGHMPSTFSAFAIILAPYWFFGFRLADRLRGVLTTSQARVFTS